MKIISRGDNIVCGRCGCVMEYTKEDIYTEQRTLCVSNFFKKYETWEIFYIECPQCGLHVEIRSHQI